MYASSKNSGSRGGERLLFCSVFRVLVCGSSARRLPLFSVCSSSCASAGRVEEAEKFCTSTLDALPFKASTSRLGPCISDSYKRLHRPQNQGKTRARLSRTHRRLTYWILLLHKKGDQGKKRRCSRRLQRGPWFHLDPSLGLFIRAWMRAEPFQLYSPALHRRARRIFPMLGTIFLGTLTSRRPLPWSRGVSPCLTIDLLTYTGVRIIYRRTYACV